MTASLVPNSWVAASGTTLTIPGLVLANDVLVLCGNNGTNNGSPSLPVGWKVWYSNLDGSTAGAAFVATKLATAPDAGATLSGWAVQSPLGYNYGVVLAVVRGVVGGVVTGIDLHTGGFGRYGNSAYTPGLVQGQAGSVAIDCWMTFDLLRSSVIPGTGPPYGTTPATVGQMFIGVSEALNQLSADWPPPPIYGAGMSVVNITQSGTIKQGSITNPTASTNFSHNVVRLSFLTDTAPNAPTLISPTPSGYVDVSSGTTFTANYNTTDGAAQSAYALRFKASGGSYQYWNAAGGVLSSTIVWNTISTSPGAQFSVTVPSGLSGGMTNGNVYSWSIASQEFINSDKGPFAPDQSFTAAAAPTVSVTAPTGASTSNQPTVAWTTTPSGSLSQTAYRVVVYSAAQYGVTGFTPGVSPATYDSGVVQSASQSGLVGSVLANLATFRAYVQVTETGGIPSTWQFTTFNIAMDAPPAPSITAASAVDGATGAPYVNLTVTANLNLLTYNQSTLETDTTGWAALANCTVTQSQTQALDGLSSLRLASTASGDMSATTPTGLNGIAVLPSTQYTVLASFRSAVSARATKVQVFWYKANGTASTTPSSTSSTVNDTTSSWVQPLLTVTSPADAAFAAVVVFVTATGGATELHYVDQISLAPGAGTTWFRGGLVQAMATAIVERSSDSGVTWSIVRGGSSIAPPASQVMTLFDFEAAMNIATQYRARIQAAV